MKSTHILLPVVVSALTACGGSSENARSPLTGPEAFALLNDNFLLDDAGGATANGTETDVANLPVGTANYDGVVAIGLFEDEDADEGLLVLGNIDVTVDFVGDTVSGTADTFNLFEATETDPDVVVTADDIPDAVQILDGTLDITGAEAAGALTVTMAGTLTGAANSKYAGDFDIDVTEEASLEKDVFTVPEVSGAEANAISGFVEGTGVHAGTTYIANGSYIGLDR